MAGIGLVAPSVRDCEGLGETVGWVYTYVSHTDGSGIGVLTTPAFGLNVHCVCWVPHPRGDEAHIWGVSVDWACGYIVCPVQVGLSMLGRNEGVPFMGWGPTQTGVACVYIVCPSVRAIVVLLYPCHSLGANKCPLSCS